MDATLQRHAAKYIYVVPEGLKELMSDISREVLRMQPQNLYVFIADYLEALLLTRENARVAARLVQSITEIAEATIEFLEKTGMEKPQVDEVVNVIHETFKKQIKAGRAATPHEPLEDVEEANIISDILHEANIGADLAEESAKIIQNAYRKFKHRKEAERELLTGMIDWRIAARSAIKLYRQTGVTNEEANRAATLIKAAYKGYYTRRIMKKLTEEQKDPEIKQYKISEPEEEESNIEQHITTDKAVKIDYDTVIPHVDFGDVTDVESSFAVTTYAIEKVVDKVMIKVGHPEESKHKQSKKTTKSKKLSPSKPTAKTTKTTPIHSKGKAPIPKKMPISADATSLTVSARSSHVSERSRTGSYVSERSRTGSHVSERSRTGSHVSERSRTGSHVSERSRTGSHVSERSRTGSHVSERSRTGSHVSERIRTGSHVSERSPTGSHVSVRSRTGSHVSERSGRVSPVSERSGRGSYVSERSGRGSYVSERSGRGSYVSERSGGGSTRVSKRTSAVSRHDSLKSDKRITKRTSRVSYKSNFEEQPGIDEKVSGHVSRKSSHGSEKGSERGSQVSVPEELVVV